MKAMIGSIEIARSVDPVVIAATLFLPVAVREAHQLFSSISTPIPGQGGLDGAASRYLAHVDICTNILNDVSSYVSLPCDVGYG
jgi:hypothetical protein